MRHLYSCPIEGFHVRTFKPRRRRLGRTRHEVYERLLPEWGLTEDGDRLDPQRSFPRCHRIVLEIGSGNGDVASSYATSHPDVGVIAVDVHRPGIARLLTDIDERRLSNLRVVEGDALVFVERLPAASIDEIWIFFPDPWPKNAQSHRRLVTVERITRLARVVRPGGVVRMASDVSSYVEQMARVVVESGFDSPVYGRPEWRPETVYERVGRAAGRASVDLAARLSSPTSR